jgi:hypothetical protein
VATIDAKLIEVALEYCRAESFERFGQALLASRLGVQFVPGGGMHDGGVDGFLEATFTQSGSATAFFQISKERDVRGKLRRTVRRLRETGRDPRQVTLLTSHSVANVDQEDTALSSELNVTIRIRDQRWIAANVNADSACQQAFYNELAPDLQFLSKFGATKLAATGLGQGTARTAYVFLTQEVERRRGNTELLEAVTDSLLLWALEGTDPEKGIFLTRGEVQERVLSIFPSAKQFFSGVMNSRLEALTSKQGGTGREIRWHRRGDKFCLPFETRKLVEVENIEDEALRLTVLAHFETRADEFKRKTACLTSSSVIAELANRTVEYAFEEQGLDTAAFLTESAPTKPPLTIAEQAERAVSDRNLDPKEVPIVGEAVVDVLRGAFYASTPDEREYFDKLSRTYTLLLSLKTEPRIVEYFRSMSSRLSLYVGSDLLVLALSEHFLPPEDQMVTTMLKVVRASGATLILCEPALEEVWGQFRASDGEYRAVFQGVERHVTRHLARHASRILVRTYLYALTDAQPRQGVPKSWPEFVEQFISYDNLQRQRGAVDLRRYLCNQFGMTYEVREDMLVGVNQEKLLGLGARLEGIKEGGNIQARALNDATIALAVYAKRRRSGELGSGNPYGYGTWWLTKEFRIRAETAELVRAEGARFLMIPEFLLNFIALAPTSAEVRRAFAGVFPTRLGIRLSSRMREEVFRDAMQKAREAGQISEPRLHAKLAELSDELKGDRFKRYERSFDTRQRRG